MFCRYQASGKLNAGAVKAMAEVGIDISHHTSDPVEKYLGEEWDYVITVCGGANENCPMFVGKVNHRLHIGFDDPSHATGTPEFIESEFRRVRDEIKKVFRSSTSPRSGSRNCLLALAEELVNCFV
jgi:arsenate reductase